MPEQLAEPRVECARKGVGDGAPRHALDQLGEEAADDQLARCGVVEAPGGQVCPTNIGDPLPVGGVPLLLWADGSASGYRLKTIKLDYVGKSVSFTTEINGQ